jgi:predicted phosphodiesterase
MRLGVLADIHENSAALDAVLKGTDRCGIELVVNLGNCFS